MGLMQFGMPYLCETKEIEDAAVLCKRLGLDFVELNMSFPKCSVDVLSADALWRLRTRYGIYFILHMDENFDPCTFCAGVREAYLQMFQSALSLARDLEVPIINMHLPRGIYVTLPEKRVYLYEQEEQHFHTCLRTLRALVEDAKIPVAVENTSGFAPYERRALDMLLESPYFGLTLDIGHSAATEECDLPFYEKHREKLLHMHAHDAWGKRDHLAFGDGQIDLHERLNRARAAKARSVLENKTIAALEKSVPQLLEFGGRL